VARRIAAQCSAGLKVGESATNRRVYILLIII
jgi:hypothetical protein